MVQRSIVGVKESYLKLPYLNCVQFHMNQHVGCNHQLPRRLQRFTEVEDFPDEKKAFLALMKTGEGSLRRCDCIVASFNLCCALSLLERLVERIFNFLVEENVFH